MRRILAVLLLVVIGAWLTSPAAQAQGRPETLPATGWGEPTVLFPEAWPDPLRFSLDDDATQLVALIPHSGSGDTSRHIVVSEFAGGAWQEPIVIAQNGAYSEAPVQTLPQQTHPVLSGDGATVAYVGYTGTTYGAYVVDRLPGGSWGAPTPVPTGLPNTHYWIGLSQDGDALALCDYPFLGTQQVYVLTRQGGVWSAPHLIGPGGNPALSPDGKKLVYVSDGRVTFTEQIDFRQNELAVLAERHPVGQSITNKQGVA
jgi:hypothetical protein